MLSFNTSRGTTYYIYKEQPISWSQSHKANVKRPRRQRTMVSQTSYRSGRKRMSRKTYSDPKCRDPPERV